MAPEDGWIVGGMAQALLRELDAYAEGLLSAQPDQEQLEERADQIDRWAHVLPKLGVPYTEFMISRAEWLHALWQPRARMADPQALPRAQAQHLACVESLRRATRRYLQAGVKPAGGGERALSALAALIRSRPRL